LKEESELIIESSAAQDWLYEFSTYPGLKLVEMSIYMVLQEKSYISSFLAHECLVACEVIARLNGRFGFKSKTSKVIDSWADENPGIVSDSLRQKAIGVIDKILSSQSEWMHLHKHNSSWMSEVSDLKNRLQA
jgi:hypothetical protein